MDRTCKRKAVIEIGGPGRVIANEEWDIYYYPTNITEWEFVDEVEHLREYYAVLALPIEYPAHIRKDIVETIFKEGGINVCHRMNGLEELC